MRILKAFLIQYRARAADFEQVLRGFARMDAQRTAQALRCYFSQRRVDWLYTLLTFILAIGFFGDFNSADLGDKVLALLFIPALVGMGWYWKSFRNLMLPVICLTAIAIYLYQGDLARAQQQPLLKYMISSQAAVLWMGFCFFVSFALSWAALILDRSVLNHLAVKLSWFAIAAGFLALAVRWHESYLIFPGYGHIPLSNLYEVFILFSTLTPLLGLFYLERYRCATLLPFLLLIVSLAVSFIGWYAMQRQAQWIQPLIPALQSYWMKIHVPANFIGYGAFSFAAMLGIAFLLKPTALGKRLPTVTVLEELMYRAVSIGFFFFTIATVLGALWAAEAWGGYWSWDPKETWALIVWLNYAAWLHLRLVKGVRGPLLAWWAVIALLLTSFAFLGVNLWLAGLHSYGTL